MVSTRGAQNELATKEEAAKRKAKRGGGRVQQHECGVQQLGGRRGRHGLVGGCGCVHYLRALHAPLPTRGAVGALELLPRGITFALEDGLLDMGAVTPADANMLPPPAVICAAPAAVGRRPLLAAGVLPTVGFRMLPVGMPPAPLPAVLVGQFTGLRACSGMRISRRWGGTAASSTPEKLNNGGRGAPSGKRKPGSRRSSKYGCAHASIADRRRSGSYVSKLAMRSIASSGARFLNTCRRRGAESARVSTRGTSAHAATEGKTYHIPRSGAHAFKVHFRVLWIHGDELLACGRAQHLHNKTIRTRTCDSKHSSPSKLVFVSGRVHMQAGQRGRAARRTFTISTICSTPDSPRNSAWPSIISPNTQPAAHMSTATE